MKILFVVSRNKSLFGNKGITAHPHIGIAYLSAFLKQHKVQVTVFDEGLNSSAKELLALIDSFEPVLIGVTVFSYCYGFTYSLIKKLKEITDIPLVVGGPHVCAVGKDMFNGGEIDFAVKQEGEFTLLELLKEIGKQEPDYSHIKGLIWKSKDGRVIENPERGLIKDLDALPFPDYDAFGLERYVCYKQKTLPLITSRGCPFGCNYCSVRLSMGQGFRPRSAENVFKEMAYFVSGGVRSFDINDDCFTMDKERAGKICDLIIANRLDIRFQLYNGIRVDTVSPQLLKKMKAAGCYFISFGCESGNDRVLKAIKKGITLQQVRDAVRWANEAGINNSVNFIIGHTTETYEDALDTINFAKSLPTNFVNFYNLLVYPGTEAYGWARQNAHFLVPPESYLENVSYRDNEPIFETSEFSAAERKKILKIGFDLYKKSILTFRLGRILGNIVYYITRNKILDKFASSFALNNRIGRFIYILLSGGSFKAKEKVAT